MVQSSQPQGSQVQKAVRRGAKAVLMSRGMNPSTRRGNKELDNLINKLAKKSYASVEDAIRIGEALGWEIVKLSEKRNQKNLDASVLRQVAESGNLFSELVPYSSDETPIESLESGIQVELDMKQGASPIEKTPEVHISGQASSDSSASQPDSAPVNAAQESTVRSEPVSTKPTDDFAASVSDVEDEIPVPQSISHAETITAIHRKPDGQDMDSEASEEAAAADADNIEDVLPEPGAKTDLSLSVAAKGSAGVPELSTEDDPVPEEAVSVASKLSGEEPDIQQARR